MPEALEARALIPHMATKPNLAAAIAIVTLGICGNATIALSPLLVSAMSQYLGYSDAFLGTLAGAESGGASIATVAALFFLDRAGWPLRRTIAVALIVYALANLIVPFMFNAPVSLTLTFLLCGCASGLVWACCATAVTLVPDNRRLIAIFYGTPYFTGMIFQPVLPWLFATQGVGLVFVLIAMTSASSLVMLRWFPARAIGRIRSDTTTDTDVRTGRIGWAGLALLPVVFALLLQYVANSGIWIYFDRIGTGAGLPEQTSASVVALGGGMALIGTALAVAFADRLKPVPTIIALNGALAISTLGFLWPQSLLIFAGSVFAFNALITLITPSYFVLIAGQSASPGRAALAGNLGMLIGYTAGPVLTGLLADHGSFRVAVYVTAVLFIASALMIILPKLFRRREPAA